MKYSLTSMFTKREEAAIAYRNATSYNDYHPAGGSESSWAWERALRKYLEKTK